MAEKTLTLFSMKLQKAAPSSTSFFPATSTNVLINPQNCLTFSFNPFATLVRNSKAIPGASPKLLNLNQEHLSKNGFSGEILIKMRF